MPLLLRWIAAARTGVCCPLLISFAWPRAWHGHVLWRAIVYKLK